MNVNELGELLAGYPPDTEVGVLTVTAYGDGIDAAPADLRGIDATITDAGSVARLWIVGVGESDVTAPALVTWRCRCGEAVTVHERSSWPHDHDDHSSHTSS